MTKKDKLKLDLQMFADKVEPSENTGNDSGHGNSENANVVDFDEQQQEHINRLVAQAKSKAKAEAEKQYEKDVQKAVEEALAKEKDYAKLSEKDRERKQREDEYAAFKAEKAAFEYDKLVNDVKSDLLAKELPGEFAEWLAVEGDTEQSLANVKLFAERFGAAVSEQVKRQLMHPSAKTGSASGSEVNAGAALAKRAKQQFGGKII